jgi:uncharacterized protein with PQ loop repeat
LPQIFTNYKQKSGHAISSLLLIGYLNAFLFLIIFIFAANLPLAYKFILPLEALAVVVLISQRLYYEKKYATKKYWLALAINILAFAFLAPWAQRYPLIIGPACGWINFAISIFYQLPQVIKIYKEKNVDGFNFLFVVFNACAALIEILTWYLGYVPAITCLSALRALLISLILFGQFSYYRKKSRAKQLFENNYLRPFLRLPRN